MKQQKKKLSKRSKRKNSFLIIGLFFLGFVIALYPISAQIYNIYLQHQKITTFEKKIKELTPEVISRRMKLANIYNESLVGGTQLDVSDPFIALQKEARDEYARMLEVEEMIGSISIPKIDVELPIYAGTSEDILQRGAGHLEGSSLPVGGKSTRAVITAHRGLPQARLFTELNKLKKNDVFYITNIKETLAYKVESIQVIEPDEVSALSIQEGRDLVTLLSCTPYMINSHRLLVTGHRIAYNDKNAKKERKNAETNLLLKIIIIISIIFILLFLVYRYFRKKLDFKKWKN
ncbi:class C sortase [Streptococcus suis]|uniref:Sortase n=1 Tax=Streptococcus suis TaxID=1307 RepID=A0A0Z8DTR2_STRSU|nr:class C sortase [Streptococcus suis]HEM3194581.1 class C sortase [Streptococcus suis 10581]MCK3895471.1 class C sortase [Streptococcus suis]NQH95112.1 class C sortase [Streptococcus suis]NQK49615.1 class C sortase [Streptococcus suis]NQM40364.1 class C sortase [Streptococcus suis]